MGFVVVFMTVLPLLVVLAVGAIKALEIGLNREIASMRTIAIYTAVFAVVVSASVGVGLLIWLASVLNHDTS